MKNKTLVLSITFLTTIFGCLSCNKNTKKEEESLTKFLYGSMIQNCCIDKTYNDIYEEIRNNKSFLIVVEPGNGCMCWARFKPILEDYIKKTHVIVYHVKYDEFYGKDAFGMDIKNGYTTFAIFNEGKLSQNILEDGKNILNDETKFNEFMDKHVQLPKLFYVSQNQVDEMYHSNEKSVIYFARKSCGDCQYVDKNFLPLYFENKDYNLYILDCQEIYDADQTQEKTQWATFKNNYGLSDTNNSIYGFNTGYVPTFLLVNGDETTTNYLSGAVYFNDSLSSDGSYVQTSYYSADRLENLQYLDGDDSLLIEGVSVNENERAKYGEKYYWNQDCAAKYHNVLLEKFFDYALPQITFKF